MLCDPERLFTQTYLYARRRQECGHRKKMRIFSSCSFLLSFSILLALLPDRHRWNDSSPKALHWKWSSVVGPGVEDSSNGGNPAMGAECRLQAGPAFQRVAAGEASARRGPGEPTDLRHTVGAIWTPSAPLCSILGPTLANGCRWNFN